MKKNKIMRFASALLVATLLSTSIISGTFAKYTTSNSSTDSARVAKWGVTVTANGSTFATTYTAEDTTMKDVRNNAIANSVVASGGAKVVAPGTKGNLVSATISGTTEVAVRVTYEATLTLSGWTIDNEEIYFPIVIKVGNFSYKMGKTASQPDSKATEGTYVYTSIDALKTAVVNAINGYSANYQAGTALNDAKAPVVSWSWDFQDGAESAYQTDVKDTALGNLSTAPSITLAVTTTVTQID